MLSAVPSCDSLRRTVILNMAAPLPELCVSLVPNSFQPPSSEFSFLSVSALRLSAGHPAPHHVARRHIYISSRTAKHDDPMSSGASSVIDHQM